jgi:hypothetical protein
MGREKGSGKFIGKVSNKIRYPKPDFTIKDLYEAALAYRQLTVCYRIGKNPSESLFNKLDKAGKIMELYEKSKEKQ